MADVGGPSFKSEIPTKVPNLEATAEVNTNGVLELLEDDEIDEDELSSTKEEID
ncbi:hypothetical protein DPMN_108799 [Dreissena polymorpha]|uniref:Uncharacterized protein n=1 Tax=Dreissena polymorpha TaxID=45954 RepID=A0A9D4K9T5_DREPO|nr:hypothetical protein DPMN_108799 [Dreissena polymorpha]